MNRLLGIARSLSIQAAKPSKMSLNFDNVSLRSLPIDPKRENSVRPVHATFSLVTPTPVTNPVVVAASDSALRLIGLDAQTVLDNPAEYGAYFAGNKLFEGSEPYAHCYCGHQFGSFAGQLGDGRAITLGEILNAKHERWEIQLKGAGKTPFSRFADGRAVLRSSIREFLCSEHMHALGVPTTRAGTLVVSETRAIRDPMYNGNQILEKCAIVSRIAPTLFRFGSWEVFKPLEGDREGPLVGAEEISFQMLDHVIRHFFPDIQAKFPEEGQNIEKYFAFYEEVVRRTARMVADWQLVGFTHGVLNTDNMSILGLTIDYGPFGFLDKYNPAFTPNTTDESGRYRFEAQPSICKWNLAKFAEALGQTLPKSTLMSILDRAYDSEYQSSYASKLRKKLGLIKRSLPEDQKLFSSLFETFRSTNGDFTNTFRSLSRVEMGNADPSYFPEEVLDTLVKQSGNLRDAIKSVNAPFNRAQIESLKLLQKESPQTFLMITGGQSGVIEAAEAALEKVDEIRNLNPEAKKEKDKILWKNWLQSYHTRLQKEIEDLDPPAKALAIQERMQAMNNSNPKYILRNYLLQNVIRAAEEGDYAPFQRLMGVMLTPFEEHPGAEDLGVDGELPEWACNSVLSCSS